MPADALKTAIATYVNRALTSLVGESPEEAEAEWAIAGINGLGVQSIEVSQVSTLEASIRIRTQHQGVRYFAVRVSEPI